MRTEQDKNPFWIETIDYEEADKPLKKIYDRVKSPEGMIDNVLKIHSLRPHTLTGHMALYKNVLHHSGNHLPKWYLEAVGVYVSHLNHCAYCVAHHMEGLKKLWQDDSRSDSFERALELGDPAEHLGAPWSSGLHYAKGLTLLPASTSIKDIRELKENGFSDGDILEINQVVAYFNYVNRSVLGLGVGLEGDVLGLSPSESDDPDNWTHS